MAAAGAEGRTMCRRLGGPAGRTWKAARDGPPAFAWASPTPPAGLPIDEPAFAEHRRAAKRRPSGESRVWLIPLAPADQHLVGGRLEGEAETEQAVEGGVRGAPAVEPEHELVEVGL